MSHIFLSYARADAAAAQRLYDEISAAGYPVWLDSKVLLVGQRWKDEIARAIRDAAAFVALISDNSVDRRGYVQKELRQGLDVLAQTPSNQIYILPVRLADVSPVEEQLQDLHWLDLFPHWEASIPRLLDAVATVRGLGTDTPAGDAAPASDDAPMKFRSMEDVFRVLLERIPPSTPESGAVNAFHVTVRTTEEGVGIPQSLAQKYPKEITFVLQHQYRDLRCGDESFSVTLWFSGEETRVTVPYRAIAEMTEPDTHIRIA